VKSQLAGVLCVAVLAIVEVPAFGQAPAQAPSAASPATHVAVIDVGYVFKNHNRFKAAMDKMKDEVMAAENGLKA